MTRTDFDHIIVGAGTAGCLLANRLSADPANRVLLIEAGGADNYPWIHIPVGYLHCIDNPRTDWRFRTEAVAGLGGRSLLYPRGRTLGGCSSINGMIYMRGQARDYDHWAQVTGDAAWDWSSCLRDFMAHESHYRLDAADQAAQPGGTAGAAGNAAQQFAAHHGRHGEWRVERQRLRWDLLDAFAAAAVQAGIPASADFNQGSNEGVGYFEVNQRSGWRWNASKAFLHPVRRTRPNLEVWTHAQVQHLELSDRAGEGLRCTGLQAVRDGITVQVHARREVILAAGAIGSPVLLQRSGLGPAALLQAHGIRIRRDLPGVGRNLQDHLQLRMVFRVQGVPTLNTLARTWWGKAKIGLEYLLTRSGPMSMAPSQLGAFTRSDASQPWPDLQYHVQPLSLEAFGQPLHPWPAFTASVCHLNPDSRGTVTLRDARADSAPCIQPDYLSTERDRAVAARALQITRQIVAQPALAPFQPEEVKPGLTVQGAEALAAAAGQIGTTIFHPVGTARMGRADDAMAVVDSHLRVLGVAGLRVVDASVMPTITSGNTNSPVLMIAEKAARWILAGV